MENTIGKRLRAAREDARLTQQQLADRLGFKDRQTVSAIESGLRKVSADELLKAMGVLHRNLEYFTDPFRLDGEGSFSWRASPDAADLISDFEAQAARWPALYRYLSGPDSLRTAPLRLGLAEKSSYEDAHHAAGWLVDEWGLGDIPALSLQEAVRRRLRALLLFVDAPEGISGAALRLPEFSAILINRREPVGRQNFNLAHELFHLLTWDTIRPAHEEDSGWLRPGGRGEQLANCFASALLMPEKPLQDSWHSVQPGNDHDLSDWLNDSAHEFRVSVPALQWRLVQLGMLEKNDVEESTTWIARHDVPEERPRRFSLDFVTVLKNGIEDGRISVRRVSALLGLTIDELVGLFEEHSLDVPFDM